MDDKKNKPVTVSVTMDEEFGFRIDVGKHQEVNLQTVLHMLMMSAAIVATQTKMERAEAEQSFGRYLDRAAEVEIKEERPS